MPGGSAEVTNRQRCRLGASSPFQLSVPLPAPSGKIYPASKRCEMRATRPTQSLRDPALGSTLELSVEARSSTLELEAPRPLLTLQPGVVFGDTFLPRWLEMGGKCRERLPARGGQPGCFTLSWAPKGWWCRWVLVPMARCFSRAQCPKFHTRVPPGQPQPLPQSQDEKQELTHCAHQPHSALPRKAPE